MSPVKKVTFFQFFVG